MLFTSCKVEYSWFTQCDQTHEQLHTLMMVNSSTIPVLNTVKASLCHTVGLFSCLLLRLCKQENGGR